MQPAAIIATCAISAATILAILLRPWRIAEWVWAVAGAAVLLLGGLIPPAMAVAALRDGWDVYLFLAGILVLAELARAHGVFDWLAQGMIAAAHGRATRLFDLVFICAIIVTALLSNDGTIVLMTPAIVALVRRVRVDPYPMVYACAFVANAASFVLPFSNPANLLVFRRLPHLLPWMQEFGLPCIAALALTYVALRITQSRALNAKIAVNQPHSVVLDAGGRAAVVTVVLSCAALVYAAAHGVAVGPLAAVVATVSVLVVTMIRAGTAWAVIRSVHWSIIPLVAALFVIVEALDRTGALRYARFFFRSAQTMAVPVGNLVTGFSVAAADNVLNNLPVAVVVRYALGDHVGPRIAAAGLVGVDLGPNLTLAGSLATLLWVVMLRRAGFEIAPGAFFRLGVLVSVPALACALLLIR